MAGAPTVRTYLHSMHVTVCAEPLRFQAAAACVLPLNIPEWTATLTLGNVQTPASPRVLTPRHPDPLPRSSAAGSTRTAAPTTSASRTAPHAGRAHASPAEETASLSAQVCIHHTVQWELSQAKKPSVPCPGGATCKPLPEFLISAPQHPPVHLIPMHVSSNQDKVHMACGDSSVLEKIVANMGEVCRGRPLRPWHEGEGRFLRARQRRRGQRRRGQ